MLTGDTGAGKATALLQPAIDLAKDEGKLFHILMPTMSAIRNVEERKEFTSSCGFKYSTLKSMKQISL